MQTAAWAWEMAAPVQYDLCQLWTISSWYVLIGGGDSDLLELFFTRAKQG